MGGCISIPRICLRPVLGLGIETEYLKPLLGFQVSSLCWSLCQQLLALAASPRAAVRLSPDVQQQPDVTRGGSRAEPPPMPELQGEVAVMTGRVVVRIVACPHL